MVLKKTKPRKNPPKHHDSTYKLKRSKVRIAHHKHTGRWLPFYCTSYAIVFFLVIFAGSLVLFTTSAARANTASGFIQLSGVVKGPPPEVPAKITAPSSGAVLQDSPVELRGTCLSGTFVEVYRQNIFAGMTACNNDGTFTMVITLIPGSNDLTAKIRDNLGQYGPDSDKVVLIYQPRSSAPGDVNSTNLSTGDSYAKSLLVYTPAVQRGLIVEQQLQLEYEIDGGVGPYTMSINWGDDSPETLINHKQKGNFASHHRYKKPGQYTVRLNAIDSSGLRASIQTIVVVHGQIAPVATVDNCDYSSFASTFSQYCVQSGTLERATNFIWPALVIASLMAISFWVGERAIYAQLRHKM